MALVLDATVGGASANTYATLAEATSYLAGRLYSAAWDDAEDSDGAQDDVLERALVTATRLIDLYVRWAGWQTYPGTQALQVPRSGLIYADGVTAVPAGTVPLGVKSATIELAFRLIQNGRMPDTPADTKGLKSLSVGSISLEFDGATAAGMSELLDAHIAAMLRPWGTLITGSCLNVPLVRM